MPTHRRLAAILFTDIVGYTSMIQRNEQEAVQAVQRHQEILELCIANHDGEIIQYYGDGSLSTFPSASQAVRCAVFMQQEFQKEPRLPLRIGIHLGEVRFENSKLYGNSVNIASRLEGLGTAGSVIISKKIQQEIRNQLDLSARFMGLFRLKNVEEPVEVLAIEAEGLTVPKLEEMQGKAELISVATSIPGNSFLSSKSTQMLVALGLVGLLLAISGWYFSRPTNSDLPTNYRLKPFTTSIFVEGAGSWSPDGNIYTYSSTKTGNQDLFIQNKGSESAIQITKTSYDETAPRWSPDGSTIAYVSVRPDGTNIYLIPGMGGLERKVATTKIAGIESNVWSMFVFGASPWSSDGSEILFSQIRENGGMGLTSTNIKTGRERFITNPLPNHIDWNGSWSPDGRSVIFVRNGMLWEVELDKADSEKLILPDKQVLTPVYSLDNKKVIVPILNGDGFKADAWELDRSTHNLRQLTYTNNTIWGAAPIPGGGISVDDFYHQVDLNILNLETMEHEQITFHNGENFFGRFSPDGTKFLYQSNRTNNDEVWMYDLEKKAEINLTKNAASDFLADWSPDGERIAFLSNRDTVWKVWIMDDQGNIIGKASETPVPLASIPFSFPFQLKWSPEGSKIAYLALSDFGPALWVLNLEDGTTTPMVKGVSTFAWYLDDNTIICSRKPANSQKSNDLVAINLITGQEQVLEDDLALTELFSSKDGKWLGYTSAAGHLSFSLYRLPLQKPTKSMEFPKLAGEPEKLADGKGVWHTHTGCFAPDAQSILYSRDADRMDTYLIEDYR